MYQASIFISCRKLCSKI